MSISPCFNFILYIRIICNILPWDLGRRDIFYRLFQQIFVTLAVCFLTMFTAIIQILYYIVYLLITNLFSFFIKHNFLILELCILIHLLVGLITSWSIFFSVVWIIYFLRSLVLEAVSVIFVLWQFGWVILFSTLNHLGTDLYCV